MQKKAIKLFHLHKTKFLKYIFIGFASVGVNNIFLFILVKLFKLQDLNSVIIAWLISVVFNYVATNIFTFQTKMSKIQFIKYLILLLFNLFIVKTATTFLLNTSLNIFFVNLFVTGFIVPYTFFIYNYYIFKPKSKNPAIN